MFRGLSLRFRVYKLQGLEFSMSDSDFHPKPLKYQKFQDLGLRDKVPRCPSLHTSPQPSTLPRLLAKDIGVQMLELRVRRGLPSRTALLLRLALPFSDMGRCQNCGPFLGPYYNTAPIIFRVPKKGP